MGAEALCSVTFNKQTSAGNALLETNEIIFRGDFRLKIELKSITALDAEGGKLKVTWPTGTATFDLGDIAGTWAHKIRTYHHVDAGYLNQYVAEYEFRHNTRHISDAERFNALLGQISGRLDWYVGKQASEPEPS